ncbi:MAG TPA: hypothetical protein VEF76_07670 [Patescibacteria group bacterium]|nr:hypothetical protein [Patescibacteria group bacterium]
MAIFIYTETPASSDPIRVKHFGKRNTDQWPAYEDDIAFAALELGYISGPSLNVQHRPSSQTRQ